MELLFVFPGKKYKCFKEFVKHSVVGIGYRIKKDLSGKEENKRKNILAGILSKRKNYSSQGLNSMISRINSFFDISLRYCIIPVKGSKNLMLVKLDSKVFYHENLISELTHFRKFRVIKEFKNAGNYTNNFGVCRVHSEKIKELDEVIVQNESKEFPKTSELINDEELYGYEGETKRQLKIHKIKERDRTFNKKYRNIYRNITYCPACSFNAKMKYGLNDKNSLLELHHIVPLKNAKRKKKTRENDVSLLCPNCHRAIHKFMSINQLKTISINDFIKNIKK